MFDVTILGAGPAGLTLAILLAREGFKVQCLERGDYQRPRVGETLGGELISLLQTLGLSAALHHVPHLPFNDVRSCWNSEQPYERNTLFNPYGQGWHVNRAHFDASLAQIAQDVGVRVQLRTGSPEIHTKTEYWQIHYHGGNSQTRFLVDASGRGAPGTRGVFPQRRWLQMDRLVAVYAPMQPVQPDSALILEAHEQGWWYAAPQPEQTLLVCAMTDADLISAHSQQQLSDWLMHTLQPSQQIKVRDLCQPARVARADVGVLWPYVGNNWCAIGDAALGGDPLGGDGVVRGMRSACDALPHIQQALTSNITEAHIDVLNTTLLQKFNDYLALRESHYLRETRFQNQIFWQRRHPLDWQHAPLFLAPEQSLYYDGALIPKTQLAVSEALLPYRALKALLYQLRTPQPAHCALNILQQHAPFAPQRLLAALQDLLVREIIQKV